MSVVASDLLIRTYAKRLKLPAVAASAERLAQEAASAGHGPLEFLAALLGAEVTQREANVERARIQAARFPELKELADFDFSLVPSLNAPLVAELARGAWIERREVVLAVGPPGTGKTHVCTALGLAACRQGRRVQAHRCGSRPSAVARQCHYSRHERDLRAPGAAVPQLAERQDRRAQGG